MILTKMTLSPEEVQIGDRLDARGKHRIAQTLRRGDDVLVKVTTRGARSATLRRWLSDSTVTIYRKDPT